MGKGKKAEWRIGEVKRASRSAYRRNFVVCFLTCIVLTFLAGGSVEISDNVNRDLSILRGVAAQVPGSDLGRAIDNMTDRIEQVKQATAFGESSSAGAISTLYIRATNAGGVKNAILEMVNKSLLDGRASQQILAILGLLLSGFFYIFVSGILDIGAYRLFLENRLYPETPLTRVLFIYRTRNTLRTAGLFLLRQFYLLLWLLTVVGFPIMYYSYYLVPLIQAENPDIPRGELFRLSTRMMRGHRFHAFRLDLSFAGWLALSVLTFGLLRYLWLNPYLRAARVELYTELRALAKAKALPGMEHLCDEALFALPQGQPAEVYPRSLYPVPVERERKWVSIGAKERYSRLNLTLLFFLFSFIGWVWECSLEFIEFGIFVNRGTLYGPWIPIYGCGGIAILLVLNRFHRRPMLCFFLAILLCGVIEYAGATLLWELRHMRYWDYSGYFLNIQGRVCLEGLLAFGILGMVGMYVIAPLADNLLEQIPREKRRLICTVLTAGFAADFALAQVWPHTGAGITTELAHPPGRGK